jgi:hypothetical protein
MNVKATHAIITKKSPSQLAFIIEPELGDEFEFGFEFTIGVLVPVLIASTVESELVTNDVMITTLEFETEVVEVEEVSEEEVSEEEESPVVVLSVVLAAVVTFDDAAEVTGPPLDFEMVHGVPGVYVTRGWLLPSSIVKRVVQLRPEPGLAESLNIKK